MVPRTTILHSSEGIIETVPRRNRTLCHAIDTVHMHGQPLSNPMPMNTCAVVTEFIGNDDCDILSVSSERYHQVRMK